MEFARFETISAASTPERNAAAIARFLDVPEEIAQDLARTPHLFDD